MKRTKLFGVVLLSLLLVASSFIPAFAEVEDGAIFLVAPTGSQGENGTTLIASVSSDWIWQSEYSWSIYKSVEPAVWNLFPGDTGTSLYTVAVSKGAVPTETKHLEGMITVTNNGLLATEGLAITAVLTSPSSKEPLASIDVDVSAKSVLSSGESFQYPYEFDFNGIPGGNYKVTADITIINHSGHLGTPFGPNPSSTDEMPASAVLVHDSVTVEDSDGKSWSFSGAGTMTYERTFTCDHKGRNDNTATIRETGQNDSASVIVNCYSLAVTKSVSTGIDREYDWSITKAADQTELTLARNQSFLVNYFVTLSADYSDVNYASGDITISNPAPMAATINSVTDLVSPDIAVSLDTENTEFPYILPPGEALAFPYFVILPDTAARTNTATVTLQNFNYDSQKAASAAGITAFTDSVLIDFSSVIPHEIDPTVKVNDDRIGSLGTITAGAVALPYTYNYALEVGPYDACGDYEFQNTASFITSCTLSTGSATYTLPVHIPCCGATLTIGYWKNHAGFGPQDDMVSDLLPIRLGSEGGVKSVQVNTTAAAVDYLSMKKYGTPSNGITKLYAQLLAAKLNIANGAGGNDVANAIDSADSFLAAHNHLDWPSLSKVKQNKVLNWMSILDQYNNGIIGPGHATE